MKKYRLTNGDTKEVSPEEEEQFLIDNEGAVLVSEKSEESNLKETDLSQSNQKTESKEIETGTQLPIIKLDFSKKNLAEIAKENKKKKKEEQNKISVENDGAFDLVIDDNFYNNNAKDAIEQLEALYGKDDESPFEYEISRHLPSPRQAYDPDAPKNLNKLIINHRVRNENGEWVNDGNYIEIDLGLNKLDLSDYNYQGILKKSNEKLFNFLAENLTEDDYLKIKQRKGQRISYVESLSMDSVDENGIVTPGPMKITKAEHDKLNDKFGWDLTGSPDEDNPDYNPNYGKPNKINTGKVNENGEPIYRELFDPVKEQEYIMSKFSTKPTVIEKVVQPYKTELEEAKQMLIKQGIPNPTKEEIETLTRENLIKKGEKKLFDQKSSDLMNEAEDTPLLSEIKVGSLLKNNRDQEKLANLILHDELQQKKLKTASDAVQPMLIFLNDPDAKFVIPETEGDIEEEIDKLRAHYKDMMPEPLPTWYFYNKVKKQYPDGIPKDKIKDAELEVQRLIDEHKKQMETKTNNINEAFQSDVNKLKDKYITYVTLEDGRKVPKDKWEQFQADRTTLTNIWDDYEQWHIDNDDVIAGLEDSDYKNNLIQKNYNDWEKFVHNIGSGFSNIIIKGGYGLTKLTMGIVGADNKTLDKTMLEIDEANRIYHETFQKDIAFEDAFSQGNFGRFLTQEIGTQIPIFATIAIPTVGIPMLGLSGAGDNWVEMVKDDAETGSQTSLLKKVLASAAYGTAEVVFDKFLTLPVMKRSFKAMYGTKGSMLKGVNGIKRHFMKNAKRQLLIDPLMETASEGLTTIAQNIITGRPITENLAHSVFSGGMFGTMFGHVPFYKGVLMNKFSDSTTKQKFRNNLSKITDLKIQFRNITTQETADIINEQIEDLKNQNDQILENIEKKMANLSPKWAKQYMELISKQENIRNKADKIINNNNLRTDTKNKALDNLQEKFDKNQRVVEMLRDPKAFGNKFFGFLSSESKKDIDRREKIFNKVTSELIADGKLDPSDKQIQEAARIEYNTEEINNDYRNKRGKTKLGKSLLNFQTVEKAIEGINKLENISDVDKAAAIKNIEEGGHGANMPTTDGNFIPLQVVENMAKDDRTETRTHELAHTIFSEAISMNPEAFTDIANQLLEHVRSINPNLHALLVAETQGMGADETITRYMELVADEKIDLDAKKNKGLGALMGWMFGKGVQKATNSDVNFDFEGETDAITFVNQLAKKIKAGTLTLKERAAIKKSKIATEAAALGKLFGGDKTKIETKKSEALTKKTIEIVDENTRLYNKVVEGADKKGVNLKEAVTQKIKDDLVVNNMATANRYAREVYESGKKKLEGTNFRVAPLKDLQQEFMYELILLSNRWDPSINPEFGAYIQMEKGLPIKKGQVLDRVLRESGLQVTSLDELTEAGFDVSDTDIVTGGDVSVKQAEGKLVNKEINLNSEEVTDIKNTVESANVSLEGLTYKGVKKLITDGPLNKVLDIVAEKFGVDPKRIRNNQDLDGKQREAARKKIVELSKKGKLIDLLPEGTDRSGKATGIAPSLLEKFYIKGGRARVKEGATAAGLPIQVKNPNITNKEFLAAFGINPDGTNKKGTSLDGALRAFILQIAQLEANQQIRKNAIEQGVPTPIVEKVGEGKSEVMFSEKVDVRISDIINVRDAFKLETNGKDELLNIHDIAKSFDLKTEQGRTDFVKNIETNLLPLMPRDFWFGPDGGTAFTASNASYGLKSSSKAYIDLRNKLKGLKSKEGVKFGKDVKDSNGNTIDFKVSAYSTIFKNDATIKKNIEDGNIDKWNEKVSIIHSEMWKRFNNAINQNGKINKDNARVIATYLGLTANDKRSWHKLGAQFDGHSPNPKGTWKKNKKGENVWTAYEYEHAMPATAAYLYLLDSILEKGVDFNTAYDLVMENYKLIALDSNQNKKINAAGLARMMPKDWSVIDNKWWERYFNEIVAQQDGGINPSSITMLDGRTFAEVLKIKADGNPSVIKPSKTEIKRSDNLRKAHENIVKNSKKVDTTGMSTFDFDETLIIEGENFITATHPITGEKKKFSSGEWATVGAKLREQGYTFDYKDFVQVRGGKEGPLLQKMKNQIDKYGPNNVFVLTARMQESAGPIHEWLKSKGINIPIDNITGLANSTGEAKAQWMLEKFGEGYNDMYFVDDALPNVEAVKKVLDQLDIKSKVVQAKVKFSKSLNVDFNNILESSKGVLSGKRFSAAEARIRGKGKGKSLLDLLWVPPSAEDFKGLVYSFLGKGKQGDADMKFFKESLFDPFAKGIRNFNTYKQNVSNDYTALKKKFPDITKSLNKKVPGMNFTNDAAVRVYLWNKAGFEIPGISKTAKTKLLDHVNGNESLTAFADALGITSRVLEGYIKPSEHWVVESIASDLNNITNKNGRKEFLSEWIENKDIIFSKENLNKIEAVYGTGFREALENMLYRMENGTNRLTGKDKNVNRFLDWVNGSVGVTMFWNIRSAALQTISSVNFLNWGDNNIFKASKAFANQPQFWKDFSFIFNSDMLKQRRAGLQIDVSASELTKAFHDGKGKPQAIIAWLLEKGFTPTRIADSFAIAMGGATFYRNRVDTYVKQGMTEAKAKEQAWLDFQEIAEETQQSSRPDLISMQQAGTLGRIILAWQNTPMQMTRLTKKALSDIVNGRGDMKSNISKVIYYGLVQNLIFGALQSALAFTMFGDDEEEIKKKEIKVANGVLDTLLRGTGIYGSALSTLKNTIIQWDAQRKKGYGKRDDLKIAQEVIGLSPPIGSKLRKLMNAIKTEQFNRGVSKKIPFRIENPTLSIVGNIVEAVFNIPLARVINKANNVEEALTGNHEMWQRIALLSGWNKWNIGVKDEELEAAKEEVKEERREEKKKIKEQKLLDEKKKIEEEKKKQGIKSVRCSGVKSSGGRCSIMVDTKGKTAKCVYHRSYNEEDGSDRDNDGVKEFRCTAITGSDKQCKNRTENKSKRCYAH